MKSKQIWILLGIIFGLFLLILVLFPPRNTNQVGSTFGKNPDGYGAWYAYMKNKGYAIEQLQKSENKFLAKSPPAPTTLLRISPNFFNVYLSKELEKWVEDGNRIVFVGVRTPATEAPFKSTFNTAQGEVTIETRRRIPKNKPELSGLFNLYPKFLPLLSDEAGTIVWETTLKKGEIIYVVTPYLAANAYQNSEGNFPYLAHLVNAPQNRVVVDEYLHGYVEKTELVQNKGTNNWLDYLIQTPLVILVLQAGIIVLICLWAQNRRFGNIVPLKPPVRNNNLDYIDALSEVLFKSENYGFLVSKITKAEQTYIQQKLGMGSASLPPKILADSWHHQGRGSKTEIMTAFQTNRSVGGIKEVSAWLNLLARLRKSLG